MEMQDRLSQLSPERRRLLQKILLERVSAKQAPQGIPRRSGEGAPPLSFAQQRLWLVDQLDPGGVAYNMRFPLRLRGALDAGVLRRA
ncbi:MAG: condensation protein, partial [Gemmatimonadetes bacterium]|nr:condensation protein [Gemmatimonadota bacterium]